MDWDSIIRAIGGDPAALKRPAEEEWSHDAAVGAALLLLEETPHPAAASVVAGIAAQRAYGPPLAAALARHVASALAEWSADPDWAERRIGIRDPGDLTRGVAHLIAALHDDAAALRDAVGIVARDGDANDVVACLAALGADGWGLLDDEERSALWTRALQEAPDALGGVWSALTAEQQADAAQRAAAEDRLTSALIGSIGSSAWEATDAALRERLIDAAAREPSFIEYCAPAWTGMSDAERTRLVTAVVDDGEPWGAYYLLDALGGDGRRALSPAQRAALDARAAQVDAWRTALLRVADAGWGSLSDAERRTLMARAETYPPGAAAFIRAVGSDVRRALPPDVQHACRVAAQRDPSALLACPPVLWRDLAGGRALPPTSSVSPWTILQWRAEDAAAAPIVLPHEHQALVLALAPWRPDDLASQSPRMARLLVAWNGMTPTARVDLATAHPWTLAVVAAAARLAARETEIAATSNRATAAVADAIAGMALRDAPDAVARATVGRMLAETGRWRPWMRAFAPTGGDPPEVWKPWLTAAQRGSIPDHAVVWRIMAAAARRLPRWMRR